MTSNPIRKRLIAYPRNGRLSLSQLSVIVMICILFCLSAAKGQQGSAATPPRARTTNDAVPKTWIDKDTSHRVTRVTDEPGSSALYFNFDAYTPDGRQMVYSSPAGIHMLDIATGQTRLLVPNASNAAPGQPRAAQRVLAVGRKTGAVYFSRMSPEALSEVYSADITSGAVPKLVTLPTRATVVTINADETLASGTYEEAGHTAEDYGNNRGTPGSSGTAAAPTNSILPGSLVQPNGKGQMMARRLAAHIPMVLLVINLQTGKLKELLHSTDWINHMLFSPVEDPGNLSIVSGSFGPMGRRTPSCIRATTTPTIRSVSSKERTTHIPIPPSTSAVHSTNVNSG